MTEYRLVTIWRIAAPLQRVYDAVFDSLRWPEWWPGAHSVEQCEAGGADGIGSVRRYTWKSGLPYRLRFDARTTRIDPLQALEAAIGGDLEGTGRWTFSHDDGITTVRYDWHVHTARRWMNLLAPIAHSVFTNNHHALMQKGAEGLARLLDARLLDAAYRELPRALPASNPIGWTAAIVAGIVAGIVATAVQTALWWAASWPLPDMLLRDARLAAAIVMGRAALPPPSSLDWGVMLAATLVHFALSICYSLLLAPLIARLNLLYSTVAGCLFGLFLFGVNMHGFTAAFPWFEASRDWITAAAHVSFGATAAIIYKLWDGRAAGVSQQWTG